MYIAASDVIVALLLVRGVYFLDRQTKVLLFSYAFYASAALLAIGSVYYLTPRTPYLMVLTKLIDPQCILQNEPVAAAVAAAVAVVICCVVGAVVVRSTILRWIIAISLRELNRPYSSYANAFATIMRLLAFSSLFCFPVKHKQISLTASSSTMMLYDCYVIAAIMAMLVVYSIRRFLQHGTPLHTTLRSIMIDPFILAMSFLFWYDYAIAALMALLAVYSLCFSEKPVVVAHGIGLLETRIQEPALWCFVAQSILEWLTISSEILCLRVLNNVGFLPHSVLLDDDDHGGTKTLFLASLRTNLVLANLLVGQEEVAQELQQVGIDPLLRPHPHLSFPTYYNGQRVRRLLQGLAQATLNSGYYYEALLPRPMMILHPRLQYEPLPIPPRQTIYEEHASDDFHLSRAILASFQLNVLLATMLGQNDSAQLLEIITDWIETVVATATAGLPVAQFDLVERRRQWRYAWRSSAEHLPHVLQVLHDLAERVTIQSELLHNIAIVSQLLLHDDPYHHTTMTDYHRRVVQIYADHVQRVLLGGIMPDRVGLQRHARAVAAFVAVREQQTASDDDDEKAAAGRPPRTIGVIIVAFVTLQILEVRQVLGGQGRV
jgi:hypothetical protein